MALSSEGALRVPAGRAAQVSELGAGVIVLDPLLLTARQRADLRELLETHPNEALAGRVAAAIGED